MGKVIIDAVSGYRRVYRPTKCEECPMYSDYSVRWCMYYRGRVETGDTKPNFCYVVSVTVEE